MMHREPGADLPESAHAKALTAIEEFHLLAAEYSVLLDTQRALIAAGNVDGAVETAARGDRIARQAAACGRRLAPWREALDSHDYSGPRASDVARRMASASARAAVLAGGAESVEAICVQKRDEAAREIRQANSPSSFPGSAVARYYAQATSARALDRHG